MMKLEQATSVVFKHEEFSFRAMAALKPILLRPKPNHLQELRIVDCKMPTQVSRDLITTLREDNQLKVLSLVNSNIGDASMQELGHMLDESKSLRELDISWNVLKPQSYC